MEPVTPRIWTRDELTLACDLVRANDWRELRAHDPRVIELSDTLRDYWSAVSIDHQDPRFRSPNSVGLKTSNIATAHQDYKGRRTKGGKLDLVILNEFLVDPDEMHGRAAAIRATIARLKASGEPPPKVPDVDDNGVVEGGLLEQTRLLLERDRRIRDKAVRAFRKQHGQVACEACSFDFGKIYGPHGEDYIECHHRIPLSQSGETTTRIEDLILLCSNCHRMIHRKRPWLSVEELVALIAR